MVVVKANEIDRLLAAPPAEAAFYLIYGPDGGLVGERATALVRRLSGGNTDPFSLVKLDAAMVAGDPRRLADEAYTVSLFGGRRTIWLRDAGGRANLAPAVQRLAADPPVDAVIVIDAGDLKKTAPLRVLMEKHPQARVIPCYVDDEEAVGRLIDQTAGGAGVQVTPDARRLLLQLLGGDRMATRGELEKLMLYVRGRDRVSEEDVLAIVSEASSFGMDEVVDAAATGEIAGLDQALTRAFANDVAPQGVLVAALRHFQALDLARAAVEAGGNPAQVVEGLRPPVFFKRKPAMIRALRIWTSPRLARALQVLGQAQLRSRRIAALDEVLVADVLLTLARIAASRNG